MRSTAILAIAIMIIVLATIAAFVSFTPPQEQPAPTPAEATPTMPETPAQTPAEARPQEAPPAGVPEIVYDENLAGVGLEVFRSVGCVACHAVRSIGVSGPPVGPDLSKTLLGNPGVSGSVIARYFAENGLEDPAADPEKAAQLIAQFLQDPPNYAPTMKAQINTYKQTYPDWPDKVKAITEMLKWAAASAPE